MKLVQSSTAQFCAELVHSGDNLVQSVAELVQSCGVGTDRMHGGRAGEGGGGGGGKLVKTVGCDKEHEEHEALVKHYQVGNLFWMYFWPYIMLKM